MADVIKYVNIELSDIGLYRYTGDESS